MVWEEKRNENGCSRSHGKFDDDNSEDDDEGQDLERDIMISPHELIARSFSKSEIKSFFYT